MATAVAPKKGLGKIMFGSHQKKTKSKVPGIDEAETESIVSNTSSKSTFGRTRVKAKKLKKAIKKKLHIKSKKKTNLTPNLETECDTSQTETTNELPSVIEYCEDANHARRELDYRTNCDDSCSSDLTTFTPPSYQLRSEENQVVENSVSGENSLPLKLAEDHRVKTPSILLFDKATETLQRLKYKRKPGTKQSEPINELSAISGSARTITISNSTSETKQGLGADTDTDTDTKRIKETEEPKKVAEPLPSAAISGKNNLPLKSAAEDNRAKTPSTYLSAKATQTLQRLKYKRKPDTKQSEPINELSAISGSARTITISNSTSGTKQGLGADTDTKRIKEMAEPKQVQLQKMAATSEKNTLPLKSAEDDRAKMPSTYLPPKATQTLSSSTSETKQSSGADTNTKRIKEMENSISGKCSLPPKSTKDHRAKTPSTLLSAKATQTLQRLRKKRESDTKALTPIDEYNQELSASGSEESVGDDFRRAIQIIQGSMKPAAKLSTISESDRKLGIDCNTDTRQEISEPLPLVSAASEESRPSAVNGNSNVEERKNTKLKGWFQGFFVCRSSGSFILHDY